MGQIFIHPHQIDLEALADALVIKIFARIGLRNGMALLAVLPSDPAYNIPFRPGDSYHSQIYTYDGRTIVALEADNLVYRSTPSPPPPLPSQLLEEEVEVEQVEEPLSVFEAARQELQKLVEIENKERRARALVQTPLEPPRSP